MTDYELEYQRNASTCGKPFPEVVEFFAGLNRGPISVLDLGCGQGRDALMIARFGHSVHGVDIASSGIRQMQLQADAESLDVVGEVTDLRGYSSTRKYDVVLLDRVVHMFGNERDKERLLTVAADSVAAAGFILIVETASNLPLVDRHFASRDQWDIAYKRKGFRFFARLEDAA